MRECGDDILVVVADKMESYEDLMLCIGDDDITGDDSQDERSRKVSLLGSWKRHRGAEATYLSLVTSLLSVCDRATVDHVIHHLKHSKLSLIHTGSLTLLCIHTVYMHRMHKLA